MDRLQELLRLHREGTGSGEVARLLSISRGTERTYWQVLQKLSRSRRRCLTERLALARQQKMPHQDFLLLILQDEAPRREGLSTRRRAQNRRSAGVGRVADLGDRHLVDQVPADQLGLLSSIQFCQGGLLDHLSDVTGAIPESSDVAGCPRTGGTTPLAAAGCPVGGSVGAPASAPTEPLHFQVCLPPEELPPALRLRDESKKGTTKPGVLPVGSQNVLNQKGSDAQLPLAPCTTTLKAWT